MVKVDVYWLTYHGDALARGYWDQGLLEEMFESLDATHHTSLPKKITETDKGGVIVINGRMHTEDTEQINQDIQQLAWVLFIITGDEEAVFPWRDIHHPLMKVWVQLPRMNQHNDAHFKLVNGYRPDTRSHLNSMGIQERSIDVFFAGQVTHARREQCYQAAKALPRDTYSLVLETTTSFGEEKIAYQNYLMTMASSKIALCPSGPESPDSFRLYEALEAGCLPIVDAFATNNQDFGFWQYLFKGDVPFPIIDYWDKLPKILPQLLKEYPNNVNKCFAWWQQYKRQMKWSLIDDIKELAR